MCMQKREITKPSQTPQRWPQKHDLKKWMKNSPIGNITQRKKTNLCSKQNSFTKSIGEKKKIIVNILCKWTELYWRNTCLCFSSLRKNYVEFHILSNSLSQKRLQYILSPYITLSPSIGAEASETIKRPIPATIQAGAALLKANSKQDLAVLKRKILHILLFCFDCSSCTASCRTCINIGHQICTMM